MKVFTQVVKFAEEVRVFQDWSDHVNMITVLASQVSDILRFVDFLIKCTFSPELIKYWCQPYYSRWQLIKRISNALTTGSPSSSCEMIILRNKSRGENFSLYWNNYDRS